MKIALVILSVIALAGIVWAIYVGVIRPTTKPNPTETQQADNIRNQNYYLQPRFGGCASLKVEAEKK